MTPRYAIYYTPERSSKLAKFVAAWLSVEPDAPGIGLPWSASIDPDARVSVTSAPAVYGFHATLKPPFFLADGVALRDLEAAVGDFAGKRPAVTLPSLQLAVLGGFLALKTVETSKTLGDAAKLHALAADAVCCLDAFRKPPSREELKARRGAGLSERQEQLLKDWGYPYVMEEFRFHMTLSNRLNEAALTRLFSVLDPIVTPLIENPLTIEAISLVEQPEPGARFSERARYPLRG